MVTLTEVERQLEALGANSKYWGRAEIIELQHILVPEEQIQACVNGRYSGGFATFVVTDQRLLVVDKKVFFLTIEDMRYDMIAEVDFSAQLLSGTIKVCTATKTLTFTTYKPKVLRQIASYIQQRVMQVRQQYTPQQAPEPVVTNANPYGALLNIGGQAVTAANSQDSVLPMPVRRNPYMNPPLKMRRRIGRFGPIGSTSTHLSGTPT